mgnify:CR=1 FL=1
MSWKVSEDDNRAIEENANDDGDVPVPSLKDMSCLDNWVHVASGGHHRGHRRPDPGRPLWQHEHHRVDRGVGTVHRTVDDALAREVTAAEAPELWRTVRSAAERMQTAPPDHIVVGLQLNFYVTELAVKHGTGTVTVYEGGLEIMNDEGTSSTVIAQAAAIVRLDV